MSTSQSDALWLRPYGEIDLSVPECGVRVLPGRLAALSHPLNKGRTLHLPDKEHYDPDLATIVSSGIAGFDPGDVVVLAPDHGAYYPKLSPDKRELRVVGVACPWWESVLAKYDAEGIHPAPGWMLIELERTDSFGLVRVGSGSQTRTNPDKTGPTRTQPYGRVLSSCGDDHTEPHKGQRVCIAGMRTYTIRNEPGLARTNPNQTEQQLALVRAPIASRKWLQSLQRQT